MRQLWTRLRLGRQARGEAADPAEGWRDRINLDLRTAGGLITLSLYAKDAGVQRIKTARIGWIDGENFVIGEGAAVIARGVNRAAQRKLVDLGRREGNLGRAREAQMPHRRRGLIQTEGSQFTGARRVVIGPALHAHQPARRCLI